MKLEFLTACYDVLTNKTLAKVLFDAISKVGAPTWTNEEISFAKALTKTSPPGAKEVTLRAMIALPDYMDKYLSDTIFGMGGEGMVVPASSDVGDVSYITPLAEFNTCCQAIGSPGYSWHIAARGSTIAHEVLLLASETLTLSGSELLRNPKIIDEAKAEFRLLEP